MEYKVDSIEGLDESIAGMYKKDGDAFVLDVAGLPVEDVSGLKSALAKEKSNAKEARAKLKTISDKATSDAADAAEKSGDIDKMKSNLREIFDKDIEKRDTTIHNQRAKLQELLIRDEASKMAVELAVDSDAVEVLTEYIQHRLSIDDSDGDFETVVVGTNGKPTGLSVSEFSAKLAGNKSLARLLKASDGQGSGATKTGTGSSKVHGNMGGSKDERIAAIKARMNAA